MGTAKKSIAVMYFKNNTGDEDLEHWREALSDLLITDLAQSKYLRVLSEKKLFYILKQLDQLDSKQYPLEVLQDVAKKGKVEYILLGSFNKAGSQFRIDIKIQEAKTGEIIGSETAQGTGEESIFTSVDELTKRIKNNFEFSEKLIAKDVDRNVGKITTSSPEAYKLYKEGEKYLREGNYPQSIQSYEKAIAIDPECAVAYASIAHVYYNLGNEAEYKKFIQKALLHANRIADKNRYKIQAAHAFFQSEKKWNEAIEAYTKLLKLYTDDNTTNNNLGALYICLEQWDEAIERFEVLIKNDYEGPHPYTNLAYLYMKKGLYDKAIKTAEELKALIEQGMKKKHIRYYYHLMGIIELKRNHSPIAIENFKKAFSLLPHQRYPDSWQALFINYLASTYYQTKDLEKACKEYEKITSLTTGRTIWGDVYAKSYYMLGKIYPQKDWKGKAIDNYQTFLDLWKDADPDIPEIIDAKKQLALLQST